MKYDANMVIPTKEEIREYKETLADNLVALRKMLYLSQTEFGTEPEFPVFVFPCLNAASMNDMVSVYLYLFVFFMNRSTKQIIFRKSCFRISFLLICSASMWMRTLTDFTR